MSETIEWLKQTFPNQHEIDLFKKIFSEKKDIENIFSFTRPHYLCKDGFSISIQASVGHYCIPKKTLLDCNYSHVEIGFPSSFEETLNPYMQSEDIFAQVPVEIVDKIIKKHNK